MQGPAAEVSLEGHNAPCPSLPRCGKKGYTSRKKIATGSSTERRSKRRRAATHPECLRGQAMAPASRTGHPRGARPRALEEAARSRVPAAPGPSPPGTPGNRDEGQPLQGAYEVNERCIEMLVNAARHPPARPFPLISGLRELLKAADPSVRRRAARRSFLLVDMEFGNPDWWHTARNHPSQQMRTPLWWGCFP